MDLPITSWTAVILAVLYIVQTFSVIAKRRSGRIVHGDGGDKSTMKRIRGHGNSAEQIPLFLILLALSEAQIGHSTWLCILATAFILGRIGHAYYFLDIGATHYFRMYGMLLTLLSQIAATLTLAISLLSA